MGSLRKIFNPSTAALIGATEKDGSVGRAIMENLLLSKGLKIFPVNPNRTTVLDVKCWPSISDVPEQVDLAVIATPAGTTPENVEECGAAGVEGIIIISAGFRETGTEGEKLEERIKEVRKKYPVRIIGPNCMGIIRPPIGLNASFLKINPEPGKIAFISQSGALGTAILDWAINSRIGFSMFASLGSMVDADFGDLIDFLGDDPYTKSIMIYMEGVGNARKFMSAARGFARNKPIIVLKSGRFSESAAAALSHTGAIAGDDSVYDAAFKRAGAIRVNEIADLFNAAEVLHSKNLPKGRKLAIVSNAGGAAVMAADFLISHGGELAQLSDETLKKLDSYMPPYWSRGNPVDVLGDADVERYIKAVPACLDDRAVDGVLVIYTPQGAAHPDQLARKLVEISTRALKPVIIVWMGGREVQKAREITSQHSVPAYETPEEAVKTYSFMYRYGRNLQLLYETPAELPVDHAPPKHHLKALIKNIAAEGREVLTEEESKRFLINYSIPITKPYNARNVEEALSMANHIGYPVVLKISSHEITHKSEVGGVVTGIDSDARLKKEYNALTDRIKEKSTGKGETGVTVQKMLEAIDYEIILGAKKDRDFGAVILFGMGGTMAEIFKDFSIGLPPLNQTLARRMMEETRVFQMLQGYRGRPPADLKQLEQIIMSFSTFIADFPEIAEVDINPLAVSNGKAYALDARIVVDKGAIKFTSLYPHLVITPYPTRYIFPWRMLDGTEVLLRPIRPEDEPLEHEMLTHLSDETLKGRFFQVIKNITHEMLIRFCNIDYEREMAFIAEIKEGEKKKIIGIGRLIIEPDFRSSEFAVVVHDDYQGRGLGYKLVDMLIGIGQEKDLKEITGSVLTENQRMLKVCEELGFKISHLSDGISRVVLTLE